MGWSERHDGAGASTELVGQMFTGDCVRMFIVTTDVPPDVICFDPTAILGDNDGATPLPGYGSQHPRNNGLFLFRYSAVGDPPNLHVTAYYRNAVIGPVDPQFFGQSGDWFEEVDSLPIAKQIPTVVTMGGEPPVGPPTPPTIIRPWQFEEFGVQFTSRQHTMSVNVGGNIGSAIAAMDDQNNRIHRINTRAYRFKAGGYNEIMPEVWVVNYHWFFDSGTLYDDSLAVFNAPGSKIAIPPFVVGNAPPDDVNHPGAVTSLGKPGARYLRLPYHKRLIVPNPDENPESRPQFPHYLPYVYEPDGWLQLVGLA